MHYEYKHEPNHNYLMIRGENNIQSRDYKILMLEQNNIRGLLDFRSEYMDNVSYYYYEISSKQSLKEYFNGISMKKEQIKSIVSGIIDLIEILNGYLLNTANIILMAEFIFIDPATTTPYFCYDPDYNNNFNDGLRELFSYFIKAIDHSDKETVEYAYELYCNSMKNNFILKDLVNGSDKVEKLSVPEYSTAEIDIRDDIKEEQPECFSEKNIVKPLLLAAYVIGSVAVGVCVDYRITITLLILCCIFMITVKKIYKSGEENNNHETILSEPAMYTDNQPVNIECVKDVEETVLMNINEKGLHSITSTEEGEIIELSMFPFVLGKLKEKTDGYINSELISRIHARFVFEKDNIFVEDMNSKNGTFINGIRMSPYNKVAIHNGDKIRFADKEFLYK